MRTLKTRYQLEIEDEKHRSIENLLIERIYGPRQLTYGQIAEEFGVSPSTIATWCRQMSINMKSIAFAAMRDPEFTGQMTTRAVRSLARARHYALDQDSASGA
jgi:AraC-like DNA-binding protein